MLLVLIEVNVAEKLAIIERKDCCDSGI